MIRLRRRDFMGLMAVAGALFKSPWARAKEKPKVGVSILQGATTEVEAQFSVVALVTDALTFHVHTDEAVRAPVLSPVRVVQRQFSSYGVYKFTVSGLLPGVAYRLTVKNGAGVTVDEREFRALDRSPRSVKIAVLSCAMDHLHRDDIWDEFANQAPELAFFIGDNVYCDRKTLNEKVDVPDPQLIWERYVATRLRLSFYYQKKLTPVLATWDDHDFGANNATGSFPYATEARATFEAFFAQDETPDLRAGPGIARGFSAFGANFILLDGRSFRGESMLGAEQRDWLRSQLAALPTWVLTGTVWFGAYGEFDSFEGDFPQEFSEVMKIIKDSGAVAAFASGDVHYSELMDIEPAVLGYPTFEIVASSMHSLTFPGQHLRFTNPRRREADSTHNFVIFEGEFSNLEIKGQVTAWTPGYDLFGGPVKAGR